LDPNGAFISWLARLPPPSPPSLASAIVQGELLLR